MWHHSLSPPYYYYYLLPSSPTPFQFSFEQPHSSVITAISHKAEQHYHQWLKFLEIRRGTRQCFE
jgi:hypothetical protein